MNLERLPIDAIYVDPANVRLHPNSNIKAIKASLLRFGQTKPIVITEDNLIVSGNGTLIAAKELGWKEINVIRTELKGAEMTAYAIADNRTAELAHWDKPNLHKQLKSLQGEDIDVMDLGWSEADMNGLMDTMEAQKMEGLEEQPMDESVDLQEVSDEPDDEEGEEAVDFEGEGLFVKKEETVGIRFNKSEMEVIDRMVNIYNSKNNTEITRKATIIKLVCDQWLEENS